MKRTFSSLVFAFSLFACGAPESGPPSAQAPSAAPEVQDITSSVPDDREVEAVCKPKRNDSCAYIYNMPYSRNCSAGASGMCPNPSDPNCAGKRCYCECHGSST